MKEDYMKPFSKTHYSGIYILKEPLEVPAYAYIRAIEGDLLAFSVLDDPQENPDFSNCGVFHVHTKDFFSQFKVYEPDGAPNEPLRR